MWCGHPHVQDILSVNVEKWQVLELEDLQGDEGCRGAGGAALGLVEVKPDSSAAGQGGNTSALGCSVCCDC